MVHPQQNNKINKETPGLNDNIDQMDLTNINRIFLPKATEYIVYRTVSKREHILAHKTNINKY
jgi:hypothetical protein